MLIGEDDKGFVMGEDGRTGAFVLMGSRRGSAVKVVDLVVVGVSFGILIGEDGISGNILMADKGSTGGGRHNCLI